MTQSDLELLEKLVANFYDAINFDKFVKSPISTHFKN